MTSLFSLLITFCFLKSSLQLVSLIEPTALISNFILTTSDLNNCSLTQGQQEFRKHLKNLEQQESEKGIELIDTIIDRIIEKLEMIMYSLSDLEKGSKICNIDIIASLYPGKSKDNIIFNDKGETKGDSYFTTTKGLKLSSGTFSDEQKIKKKAQVLKYLEVFILQMQKENQMNYYLHIKSMIVFFIIINH